MEWRDLGSSIAKVAPVLGAVVGGPIGAIAGAAGTLISSFLGVDATPEAVSAAIANPEMAVRLKELEMQHQAVLIDWQSKQLDAELENTKDARAMPVQLTKAGSHMGTTAPAVVSVLVTVGFGLMLWKVLGMEGEPSQAAVLLLGSLSTAFGAVVNFYLGSSLGSYRKDDALRAR